MCKSAQKIDIYICIEYIQHIPCAENLNIYLKTEIIKKCSGNTCAIVGTFILL